MKKIVLVAVFFVASFTLSAQVKTPAASPRANFEQTVGLTDIEIDYSRPSAKGRAIFGDLVPFGKIWRTGANQNSMITFSDDVTVDGKTLKKGKYALFVTPKADNWEVIFYTNTENWGTPEKFEESKVAARVNVKPETLNRHVETFTISLNNVDNDFAHLEFAWEKTVAAVKIEVPTKKTAMANIEKVLAGPAASDYFASAQYYYQSNGDIKKALEYVNKATEMTAEKGTPFWYNRLKSLIQAKAGDKKGAIETAKVSLEAAEKEGNADYVKMNKDSIAEWSKK
ncbi:MAG TPA: DUF2911 domain-containing protein [Flavobacterium sp.]|uniref:DUF2911 domain-containing protein n=1 Tax=unclassified Flavobacterium TaxID=196869 RepID=UPI000E7DAEDD|nr:MULTISPECIES: DUF2911 domain-containing protein [unclassified Flavobacterium]HBI00286.1 dihydrolipoamide dehydrogenase [Flavobacterium sp.]HRE78178.1 DUF2911 domain-containing protein [Flavobacterium sp.]